MHEEKHLEADAADAVAGSSAEGIKKRAEAVEIKRVAEEERVARVEEVLCFVVDEPVDAQKFARGAVFADPAGAHLESAVAAARREGVAAVVDHDHGLIDAVFIRDGQGVFIDFEA